MSGMRRNLPFACMKTKAQISCEITVGCAAWFVSDIVGKPEGIP